MTATDTAAVRTPYARRLRGLLGTGLLATLAAMAAVTIVAALARAAGVDFEVEGGEQIPLSGFAVLTGVFSVVGIGIAAALLRWSTRPATWLTRTTVTLTALSLVPPVLWGEGAATVAALVVLHLVAAAVVVPALVWSLRDRAV